MKLAPLLTTCAVALLLAACGMGPAGSVGVCGLMARELAGARGATPRDQAKIDATQEAAVRARCVARRLAFPEG